MLLDETRSKLGHVTDDKAKYKGVLEGLITQVSIFIACHCNIYFHDQLFLTVIEIMVMITMITLLCTVFDSDDGDSDGDGNGR